jgi:hypothetical protein
MTAERHDRIDALIAAVRADLEQRKAEAVSPLEHAARIWEQATGTPDP